MIGSFLTRGLVLIFGYAYPAYECYKTVEKNKPEIEQLRFWCQYWILVAVLTVCERFGDAFISWVPMYSEAKLAFFVYLWYPKTKGTTYVYDSFFRPYLAKHETEIDQNLLELRTRAGDIAVLYWQRAASYGQTRIYDILHYVAAQSTPQPRPSQPQQPSVRVGKTPATSNQQAASPVEPQTEEPPSPTSSTSSSQHQKEVAEEVGRTFFNQRPAAVQQPSVRVGKTPVTPNRQAASPVEPQTEEPPSPSSSTSSSHHQKEVAEEVGRTFFKRPPAAVGVNTQKATAAPKPTSEATPTEAEPIQIEVAPSSNDESTNPAPKETLIEEAIRVTRGRLRKARSAGKSAKNES